MTQAKFPFPTTPMYVTSTWVSDGIIEIKLDQIRSKNHDGFFSQEYVSFTYDDRHGFSHIGKGIFYTKEEAVAYVEKKRKKRIASLKEQIEKLENMKFD
jgi:hypothetical protein